MLTERRTRTLLAPADPADDVAIPGPALPAHEMIRLAEQIAQDPLTAPERAHPRPRRRVVLAAALATATAAVVATVALPDDDVAPRRPVPRGAVIVPIAYTIPGAGQDAAPHLRAMATNLTDAPFDLSSGPYTFIRQKSVGVFGAGVEDQGLFKAAADEWKTWVRADLSGRLVATPLPAEYPNEASRRYFDAEPDVFDNTRADDQTVRAGDGTFAAPVPLHRSALAKALRVERPDAVADALTRLYTGQGLPRTARAEVLRILADQHVFRWRGPVVDRLGRPGVALTHRQSDSPYEDVVVLDRRTGELLSYDSVRVDGAPEVTRYTLLYDVRHTTGTN
ncbi:hypothetical protein AB0368_28545 [Actinoplanes sp. NPDC051475]|uniref:hypothetical protein n=1 Tax=Actinoplanes sp. NPDC051475 TaxID=3157225 RepID=UPI00345039E3